MTSHNLTEKGDLLSSDTAPRLLYTSHNLTEKRDLFGYSARLLYTSHNLTLKGDLLIWYIYKVRSNIAPLIMYFK